MNRSAEELAQTERLENAYEYYTSPVVRSVTNDVCGCGYVCTSYTTREEAEEVISHLGLTKESELLEIGAGAGWPSLYFAYQSGCQVTLLDLPESGLQIARDRAAEDGTSDRVGIVRGDASCLPFGANSFSAINHSDVLCCLLPKRTVLEECRRVIRRDGRMALSVLDIDQDLKGSSRAAALDAGPEFVETDQPYPEMLRDTGWRIISVRDLTANLELTYTEWIDAERRREAELRQLAGDEAFEDGQARWELKRSAVRKGLLRRDLYVVAPD